MNRKQLFYRTESILKEAYRTNTIRYRLRTHCVDANLMARNMGFAIGWAGWYNEKGALVPTYRWFDFIRRQNTCKEKFQLLKEIGIKKYLKQMRYVAVTGYTAAELVRIEEAFENCYNEDDSAAPDVIKGLIAVFAVLREIHNVTDKDLRVSKEIAQNNTIIDRFVNRYAALSSKEPSGRP